MPATSPVEWYSRSTFPQDAVFLFPMCWPSKLHCDEMIFPQPTRSKWVYGQFTEESQESGRQSCPERRAQRHDVRTSSAVRRERRYLGLVPKAGLEPARLAPHAPQTCVSAIPPLRPLRDVATKPVTAFSHRTKAPYADYRMHRLITRCGLVTGLFDHPAPDRRE